MSARSSINTSREKAISVLHKATLTKLCDVAYNDPFETTYSVVIDSRNQKMCEAVCAKIVSEGLQATLSSGGLATTQWTLTVVCPMEAKSC